jgi:hypothetical protein
MSRYTHLPCRSLGRLRAFDHTSHFTNRLGYSFFRRYTGVHFSCPEASSRTQIVIGLRAGTSASEAQLDLPSSVTAALATVS